MEIDNNIFLVEYPEGIYLRILIPGEYITAKLINSVQKNLSFELFFDEEITLVIQRPNYYPEYELKIRGSTIKNPIKNDIIRKYQFSENQLFNKLFILICREINLKNCECPSTFKHFSNCQYYEPNNQYTQLPDNFKVL